MCTRAARTASTASVPRSMWCGGPEPIVSAPYAASDSRQTTALTPPTVCAREIRELKRENAADGSSWMGFRHQQAQVARARMRIAVLPGGAASSCEMTSGTSPKDLIRGVGSRRTSLSTRSMS